MRKLNYCKFATLCGVGMPRCRENCKGKDGEMPERLNGAVSKTVISVMVSGVRIPLSPPNKTKPRKGHFLFPGACKACFAKRMGMKKWRRAASALFCLMPPTSGISEANPPLSAKQNKAPQGAFFISRSVQSLLCSLSALFFQKVELHRTDYSEP